MAVFEETWDHENASFGDARALDGDHQWRQGGDARFVIGTGRHGWRVRDDAALGGFDTLTGADLRDVEASVPALDYRNHFAARCETAVGSADMYARAVVEAQADNPDYFALFARTAEGDGSITGYAVRVRFGSGDIQLLRVVAGTITELDDLAYTFTANDVIELRCDGDDITGWLNSTEILSATDANITTGDKVAIAGSFSNNDRVLVASVKAGTITAGTPDETVTVGPLAVVEWTWPGIPTTTTVEVSCHTRNIDEVRLIVSVNSDLTSPTFTGAFTAVGSNGITKLAATGLTADTAYHYGIEWDDGTTTGLNADRRGEFTTAPVGAETFSFSVVGDHSRTNSGNDYMNIFRTTNAPTFDFIAAHGPAFHYISGDLNYRNPVNDQDFFRRSWRDVLSGNAETSDFLRSLPSSYVWDDHDYSSGVNVDGSAVGQPAATATFRQVVPHPPLGVDTAPTDPVGHSWTWGRVRFIALDHRSASSRTASPRTVLGTAQKAWFKALLLSASEPLIVVFVGFPWIQTADSNADSWAGFNVERAELAEFFEDNNLTEKLLLIHADSHSLAIDDGTNTQYDTGSGNPGPPLFCCAPADSITSIKGGPYSEGTIPASAGTVEQQYGLITITDTGTSTITVDLDGYQLASDGLSEAEVITYQFTVDAPEAGVAVGQASETETANPITPLISRAVSVGQASESEGANSITPLAPKDVAVGSALEVELANSITPVIGRLVPIGVAAEAETGQPITPSIGRAILIGQASEVELARLISPLKPISVPVQTAVERELANSITVRSGDQYFPLVECVVLALGVECEVI